MLLSSSAQRSIADLNKHRQRGSQWCFEALQKALLADGPASFVMRQWQQTNDRRLFFDVLTSIVRQRCTGFSLKKRSQLLFSAPMTVDRSLGGKP